MICLCGPFQHECCFQFALFEPQTETAEKHLFFVELIQFSCWGSSLLLRADPSVWSIQAAGVFFWGGGAHTNSNTFFARCLPCLPDLPRCNFSCSPKTYSVWSLVVLTHQRWCSVITMVLTMKFESGYFIYSSQSHRTLWSYLMGNISLKSFYCNQKQIFRTSDCVTSIQ